jgi:hypothetical protein
VTDPVPEHEPQPTSKDPRWVVVIRVISLGVLIALGVAFAIAILNAQSGPWLTIIGLIVVVGLVSASAVRLWVATRPYGYGAWDQRHGNPEP